MKYLCQPSDLKHHQMLLVLKEVVQHVFFRFHGWNINYSPAEEERSTEREKANGGNSSREQQDCTERKSRVGSAMT